MINRSLVRPCGLGISCMLLLALATSCGTLISEPPPAFYMLNGQPAESSGTSNAPKTASITAPTLMVNIPHAGPGFDGTHIIYVRKDHQLEFFAHHAWVDIPARMLAPLMVTTLEHAGIFHAVTLTPSAAVADLRLDSEIIRLQQNFASTPSQVRFTLRAYLTDNRTRKIMAWREFDETLATTSDDAYGGIRAANQVVMRVMEQLAAFCAEATPPVAPRADKQK